MVNDELGVIDKYIESQPEEVRMFLHEVAGAIEKALPEAKQKISWGMPTYYDNHNIIHFGAHKNHLGIYPGPAAIEYFADRLIGFKTSKGAIQIPYSQNLPLELIGEIATWCLKTGHHH